LQPGHFELRMSWKQFEKFFEDSMSGIYNRHHTYV
jgi:hypothetical protein